MISAPGRPLYTGAISRLTVTTGAVITSLMHVMSGHSLPAYSPSGGADATAGDAGRDDLDEQLPIARRPGLYARAAGRVQLGSLNMTGRPWTRTLHPRPAAGSISSISNATL